MSWSAVSGSGITYTVCYSTTSGTRSDPPSGATCDASGITVTSTTLGSLSRGTTYYIWVAAVSSGGRGPYSDRRQQRTYQGKQSRGNCFHDSPNMYMLGQFIVNRVFILTSIYYTSHSNFLLHHYILWNCMEHNGVCLQG